MPYLCELLGGRQAPADPQSRVAVGDRLEDQERQHRDDEQHAERGGQPADDKALHQRPMRIFARGSSASRTPSPNTLMLRTPSTSMMPGTSTRWMAAGMSLIPSEIMVPHDGLGGWTPAPRYDRPASSKIELARISGMNTMNVEARL